MGLVQQKKFGLLRLAYASLPKRLVIGAHKTDVRIEKLSLCQISLSCF